jgi:shikimate kinase
MSRVLITGMSGTGKSTVIAELARLGYRAIDLDTPEWSHWVDADPGDMLTPTDGQDWVWREDRVRELLSQSKGEDLFVSGCAENMGSLFDAIDTVILLSAPMETIMDRLNARSGNDYGKTAEERSKVAELIRTVEPLLRDSADFEIDTQRPIVRTIEEILTKVFGAAG